MSQERYNFEEEYNSYATDHGIQPYDHIFTEIEMEDIDLEEFAENANDFLEEQIEVAEEAAKESNYLDDPRVIDTIDNYIKKIEEQVANDVKPQQVWWSTEDMLNEASHPLEVEPQMQFGESWNPGGMEMDLDEQHFNELANEDFDFFERQELERVGDVPLEKTFFGKEKIPEPEEFGLDEAIEKLQWEDTWKPEILEPQLGSFDPGFHAFDQETQQMKDVEMVNFDEFDEKMQTVEGPELGENLEALEVQPTPEWFQGVQADLESPFMQDVEIVDRNFNILEGGGFAAETLVEELEEGIRSEIGWGTLAAAWSLLPGVIAWGINQWGTRHPNKHQIGRLGYVSDRAISGGIGYNYQFSELGVQNALQIYLPMQIVDVKDFKTFTVAYKDIFQYPRKNTFLRERCHLLDLVHLEDEIPGEKYTIHGVEKDYGGYLTFTEDTPLGFLKPIVRTKNSATPINYYPIFSVGSEVKLKENNRLGKITRGYVFDGSLNQDFYQITLYATYLVVYLKPNEFLIQETKETFLEEHKETPAERFRRLQHLGFGSDYAIVPIPEEAKIDEPEIPAKDVSQQRIPAIPPRWLVDPHNKMDPWFRLHSGDGFGKYQWDQFLEHWVISHRDSDEQMFRLFTAFNALVDSGFYDRKTDFTPSHLLDDFRNPDQFSDSEESDNVDLQEEYRTLFRKRYLDDQKIRLQHKKDKYDDWIALQNQNDLNKQQRRDTIRLRKKYFGVYRDRILPDILPHEEILPEALPSEILPEVVLPAALPPILPNVVLPNDPSFVVQRSLMESQEHYCHNPWYGNYDWIQSWENFKDFMGMLRVGSDQKIGMDYERVREISIHDIEMQDLDSLNFIKFQDTKSATEISGPPTNSEFYAHDASWSFAKDGILLVFAGALGQFTLKPLQIPELDIFLAPKFDMVENDHILLTEENLIQYERVMRYRLLQLVKFLNFLAVATRSNTLDLLKLNIGATLHNADDLIWEYQNLLAFFEQSVDNFRSHPYRVDQRSYPPGAFYFYGYSVQEQMPNLAQVYESPLDYFLRTMPGLTKPRFQEFVGDIPDVQKMTLIEKPQTNSLPWLILAVGIAVLIIRNQ